MTTSAKIVEAAPSAAVSPQCDYCDGPDEDVPAEHATPGNNALVYRVTAGQVEPYPVGLARVYRAQKGEQR